MLNYLRVTLSMKNSVDKRNNYTINVLISVLWRCFSVKHNKKENADMFNLNLNSRLVIRSISNPHSDLRPRTGQLDKKIYRLPVPVLQRMDGYLQTRDQVSAESCVLIPSTMVEHKQEIFLSTYSDTSGCKLLQRSLNNSELTIYLVNFRSRFHIIN